jgi:hypothetical protein
MAFIHSHRIPLTMSEAREALDSLRVDSVLLGAPWGASTPAGRLVLTCDPSDRAFVPACSGRRVDGVIEVGQRRVRVEVEVLPFSANESEVTVRQIADRPRQTRFLHANTTTVRDLVETMACAIVGAAADLVTVRTELVAQPA